VAGLALVEEALRIEANVRVITVDVIQPYSVMDYLARFLSAYLTKAAVY
jgi:hypothetical protein